MTTTLSLGAKTEIRKAEDVLICGPASDIPLMSHNAKIGCKMCQLQKPEKP